MIFDFQIKPIGLARPRFNFKSGHTYNSQKAQMTADKIMFADYMRSKSYSKLQDGPIMASVILIHPIPPSWPQKRRKEALNASYVSTPDIDNCVKYYLDVMNGIAYSDDKFISRLYAEQLYADTARVKIQLHELENPMIDEKILTTDRVLGETFDDICYLVKKANRLGLNGREIENVGWKCDNTGCHYYFYFKPCQTPPTKPLT